MTEWSREEWEESFELEIIAKRVPRLLYKFRRWTNDYDKLILTGPAVWFASPASFNDPFDCRIPYRYDMMAEDAKLERARRILHGVNPNWDEQKTHSAAEQGVRENEMFSSDRTTRRAAWERYGSLLAERYGILSLAGNCENILMWSHYSEAHGGLCIELDARMLAKHLFDLSRTNDEVFEVYQVGYQVDFPEVIPCNDEDEDRRRYMSLLTTKSSDWKYEQEWRFISLDRTRFERPISENIIKRVILGCRMPPDHRQEVYELVKSNLPDAEVWVAETQTDKFGLDLKPWRPA